MLESLITSKTRLKLLIKFFSNSRNHAHLRGLADEFGESTNAIRKELINLSEAGFLHKVSEKNKIEYKANIHHPMFTNLQDIIQKYLGFDRLLQAVLERMGAVEKVALVGDYAQGIDSGTIEVQIQGKALNEDYLGVLEQKIEGYINRKVKFTIKQKIQDSNILLLYTV
jgi:hypothetical protein